MDLSRNHSWPIKRCPACGSTWFREVVVQSIFVTAAGAEARGYMLHTVLVCLCGTPVRPNLGGIRRGRTPNTEIEELFESFSGVDPAARQAAVEEVLHQCREQGGTKAELQELRRRLAKLEKTSGQQLAKKDPERSPRGRHWRLPERTPAGRGRDWLAGELQKRGFTFDQAREVVGAIWEAIREALREGQEVETPLGTFRVVTRPKARSRWRFRKIQRLYQERKKVILVPPGAGKTRRRIQT